VTTPRLSQTATLVPGGKVLIATRGLADVPVEPEVMSNMTTDNAEDFKQGAKVGEALECREGTGAPCLKFRCAKPLHTASSYVF